MRRAACVIAFIVALSGGARAVELSEMVRELNVLQNRMATGDVAARDRAAQQFDLIEKAIDNLEPEGWSEERNQRAAIIYLLSGGAPGNLREIHEAEFDTGKLAPLMGASIEYAEGRDGGAPKTLQEFDARQFPPILGGHLALIQGSALIGEDNARAITLLDLARLLMPGSLVEEAALRREIAILDPVRDSDKVALLSARYVSKYHASPYSANFWEVFRRATVADRDFLPRLSKFESVFVKAPANERAALFLESARLSVLAGKLDEARRMLESAGQGSIGPVTQKRIGAYRNVLAALTQESGAQTLNAQDLTELGKQDAALVGMASGVAEALSNRPPPVAAADDEEYEMAKTVRQALVKSDELLRKAAPQ